MRRVLGIAGAAFLLFLPACKQKVFEHLVNLPSKFELVNFNYGQRASLQIACWFGAYVDNKGDDCAQVVGTIDWGDGVVEPKENITPCISVQPSNLGWSTIPSFLHSYPAVGKYVVKVEFTARFTNGFVTSKLEVNVDITY